MARAFSWRLPVVPCLMSPLGLAQRSRLASIADLSESPFALMTKLCTWSRVATSTFRLPVDVAASLFW